MNTKTAPPRLRTITGLVALFLLVTAVVAYSFESFEHLWSRSFTIAGLLVLAGYLGLQFGRYREIMQRRSTRFGANMAVYVLIVVAILAAVNYLAEKHTFRWDATETGLHTLAPQSVKILDNLDRTVSITAFFHDNDVRGKQMEELLSQYAYTSAKVTYRILDPDRHPAETRAMKAAAGTIVLKAGDREEKYFVDQDPTEHQLTNAILKVIREGKKIIYFVGGHGEKSPDDSEEEGLSLLTESLRELNYEVEILALVQQPEVPSDASVVVVCGPQKPLTAKEEELLASYVSGGGRLLVQVDPAPAAGLENLLGKFGITAGFGLIIDTVSQIFGVNFVYAAVMNYPEHPINDNFDFITMYPEARPLTFADEPPPGVLLRPLAATAASSWAERGPLQGEITFDPEQDEQGPVTLALVASRRLQSVAPDTTPPMTGEVPSGTADPRTGVLIAFGDSDFVTNKYVMFQGNLPYYLNVIHHLAGENDLVAVGAKQFENRTLMLTEHQQLTALWTAVFLPLLIMGAGMFMWLRRRG